MEHGDTKLRDGVYGEMCSAADASDNVGYIEYRQTEPEAGEDVPAEA